MASDSVFLGSGWGFPPTFEPEGRSVRMFSDVADIESSLEILLSTRPGERILNPTYGCNLDRLVFENLDTSLKTFMADLITTAILYHEPRIAVETVDFSAGDDLAGVVLIEIGYIVRSTNSRRNLVFPFYKKEGGQP